MRPRSGEIALWLVPVVLYLLGVALLGDWIMDDAGISYAYARNVAGGHGFVSQIGRAPVEGFSNFLWVLLLVPLFWAGLFHAVLSVKALSALLVLVAIAILHRGLRRGTGRRWPARLATVLVATAAPVVVWTASGLENGLTLLLVSVLWAILVERPTAAATIAGVVAALLALTRPDGVLYVFAGPLVLAATFIADPSTRRHGLRDLGANLVAFFGVFAPFMAFRLTVFGLPFPHTYYAKRMHAGHWERAVSIVRDPGPILAKGWDLLTAIGPIGPAIVAGTLLTAVLLAVRRRLARDLAVALVLQGIAGAAYLWLDDDWMGEYRFGTAAVAMSLVAFAAAAAAVLPRLEPRALQRSAAALLALACAFTIVPSLRRIVRFAANPPTSFADVERLYAARFDAYAATLGVRGGSILLADIGGTLMRSHLRVYDVAGLIEPAVVVTLRKWTPYWPEDRRDFHDWVFEEARPTFITTNKFWTWVTAFELDPRFARDYVAIERYRDRYVAATFRRDLHSGDFVRRDALAGPAALEAMRTSDAPPPRPEPLVYRLADAWAARTRPAGVDELRQAAVSALARRDPNRAAHLLGRLLEQAPADLDAAHVRAVALDDAGRTDEARREWTRVLRLAAGRHEERVARERLAPEGRAAVAATTGAGSPKDAASLMREGLDFLYAQGDPVLAIPRFADVLVIDPTHYGAHYQLAVALDRAGRPREARVFWTKVLAMAQRYGDAPTATRARARLQRTD